MTLKETIDILDHRLAAGRRQLQARGELGDVRDIMMADNRRRQGEILRRVESALQRGAAWDLVWSELALEFNGLVASLLAWQERLDAETVMRMRRH
jgi:hypothetical protein